MATSGMGFGTSGARGTVEAMTDPVCYAYTVGFLQAMAGQGRIVPGDSVYLAGDLRPSTGRILAACQQAVADSGYQPVYTGRLPSPAVACYAMQQQAASVMVTGSHIPDDRNGIKFNRPDGEILKTDEAAIKAQSVELPAPFPVLGEALLPAADPRTQQHYVERYTQFFPAACLAGMRIGVYQHSGVARDLLVEILEALGAVVTPLARSGVFVRSIPRRYATTISGWAGTGLPNTVSTPLCRPTVMPTAPCLQTRTASGCAVILSVSCVRATSVFNSW